MITVTLSIVDASRDEVPALSSVAHVSSVHGQWCSRAHLCLRPQRRVRKSKHPTGSRAPAPTVTPRGGGRGSTAARGMRLRVYNAAMSGRLEVLQWAREQGCPWDEMTCGAPLRADTRRCCSGRGSTTARGTRGCVLMQLCTGTRMCCGGRGSTGARARSTYDRRRAAGILPND